MADEQKNPEGRPPKYKTPEELERAILAYFKEKEEKQTCPTIAGLCLALGFCERHALIEQVERGEQFSPVVKRAKLCIENYHETRIATTNTPAGSIFWLKNHSDYKDVQEHTIGGIDGHPIEVISDPVAAKAFYAAKLALLESSKQAGTALSDG